MKNFDPLMAGLLSAWTDLRAYVARRVGGDEADDVLQEVWIRLSLNGGVESWREPRAMLFATAGNLAVDRLRSRRRDQQLIDAVCELPEVEGPADDPGRKIDGQRALHCLCAALDELPVDCRDAFLMNRLEGLTHREIATRLGVSTKTVQRHIERALGHCLDRLPT